MDSAGQFGDVARGADPGKFVPLIDYELVFKDLRPTPPPTTAIGLYMEIVSVRDFRSQWLLSALSLSLAIIAMYFLGRFVTARIGTWFVRVGKGQNITNWMYEDHKRAIAVGFLLAIVWYVLWEIIFT